MGALLPPGTAVGLPPPQPARARAETAASAAMRARADVVMPPTMRRRGYLPVHQAHVRASHIHFPTVTGIVVYMEFTLAEVADRLGVSERRARQIVADGRLPARRVAGRWFVAESAIPRSQVASRPMSPRIAWAFIDLLSERPVDVSPAERHRLVVKRARLLASPNPAALLRSWLSRRAALVRVALPPGDLPALLEDPRVVPSGLSDPRAGLSGPDEAEAYVHPAALLPLMRDYLMAEVVESPNAWLHVSDRDLPRPAPLGLVVADLADHDGPREDARVRAILGGGR